MCAFDLFVEVDCQAGTDLQLGRERARIPQDLVTPGSYVLSLIKRGLAGRQMQMTTCSICDVSRGWGKEGIGILALLIRLKSLQGDGNFWN